MRVISIDMKEWIKDNKSYFIPPICNKMMHNTQLKVFFVGGPNQRKDYHIEEGEEGDMCLKTIEKGKPKDVVIKEGQVFLLPPKVPHSPQRFSNTIGLVIERVRLKTELDALRYFVEDSTDILYERWFYCENLGTQLVPIIKQFEASQQYKTGKPMEDSRLVAAPYDDDQTTQLMTPFHLEEWFEDNQREIDEKGFKQLFGAHFQSNIRVFGGNQTHVLDTDFEVFILQLRNSANIKLDSKCESLEEGKTVLISKGHGCLVKSVLGSYTLAVSMLSHK